MRVGFWVLRPGTFPWRRITNLLLLLGHFWMILEDIDVLWVDWFTSLLLTLICVMHYISSLSLCKLLKRHIWMQHAAFAAISRDHQTMLYYFKHSMISLFLPIVIQAGVLAPHKMFFDWIFGDSWRIIYLMEDQEANSYFVIIRRGQVSFYDCSY